MRGYLYVAHQVPSTGDFTLDDLAGGAGRVDAACRVIQASLFTSHGLRQDTECWIVCLGTDGRPATVRFDPKTIRNLHPDERSTAARIRQALEAWHEDPWFEEVQSGLHVAPFDLSEAIDAWEEMHGSPIHVLDKDGDGGVPVEGAFVLSDHLPFTAEEQATLSTLPKQRVGTQWYHGNQVVAALQIRMDGF